MQPKLLLLRSVTLARPGAADLVLCPSPGTNFAYESKKEGARLPRGGGPSGTDAPERDAIGFAWHKACGVTIYGV
jgi:hypothetical protein